MSQKLASLKFSCRTKKHKKTNADEFITNMISYFQQTFGDDNTFLIFGPSHGNNARRSATQSQLSHSKLLRYRINGNPQSCDDDSTPPPIISKQTYFGKPPLQPTTANTQSFVDAVSNSSTSTSIDTTAESRIRALKLTTEEIKNDSAQTKEDIKKQESITTLSEDLIRKIEEAKQANNDVVQEFIKKQTKLNTVKESEALKRENDFKDWIKKFMSPKPDTPSGVEQGSARGGEE